MKQKLSRKKCFLSPPVRGIHICDPRAPGIRIQVELTPGECGVSSDSPDSPTRGAGGRMRVLFMRPA